MRTKTLNDKTLAAPREVTQASMASDRQRFFASYSSWSSLVREGYADALPVLGKTQDAQEKQQALQRAKTLTEPLTRPLLPPPRP